MIRPSPVPNADTRPYWEAAERGELAYRQCLECGKAQFPPGRVCRRCRGETLEWRISGGCGTVHSFTVVHRAPTPAFAAPYAILLVDLEEGFRIMTNLRHGDAAGLAIGSPVRIVFEPSDGGPALPQAELRS
ncbi:hypothetical protein VY88_22415 [Azospirillum thiophilum]|uniref:DNA-binding protein n=1 Tax=Azospirillum thiophilum TaxID=528244 RepID=A0AAC8W1T5_9PROT|nr:Zn-ribbon domain-containing OB-fold protein [Azospirillum thiophilum]ALG73579.1 hypothetical protein AL072_21590 [Azospirillum thiophilum]KJR62968.1 hypothetical protein VY88_22415 [Azospirillum thiophilum]